ncbi:MAG TPA: TolC family protein [Tangfeifania sp.]|nr:TolC family protein [Tangfeifania sp.]
MKTFKTLIFSILCVAIMKVVPAQQNIRKIELTLEEAIAIAQDSSLRAFIEKNEYLRDYWDFRTYQAEFLPILELEATPFNYDRAVREVYNSQDEEYQFIQSERLNSYANLSLTQNIPFTGGRIYIDSDLGRIHNIGGKIEYSSTPIRIGLRQDLFDFNDFKWEKKTEPVEFERSKKEFFQSSQEIADNTVYFFFNLLFAQIELKTAQNDFSNAETLYRDGMQRREKGNISLEDIYSLELSLMDANSDLERAETNVRRTQTRLLSFLRMDKSIDVELIPPDRIYPIDIDEQLAIEIARKNNPDILDMELDQLYAERSVEQAKKSRYSADLRVSMGLNQTTDDNRIRTVYQNLENQQRVEVSMNIPIIDWGLSKKRLKLAQSNREVVLARMEQAEIDFDEDVRRTVEEFNMQKKLVQRAAKADTLAQMMYDVTQQRYMDGELDIIKLNSAQNRKNSAREDYFERLEEYWEYYYEIREMTLYDFVRNRELSIDYSDIFQAGVLKTLVNNGKN